MCGTLPYSGFVISPPTVKLILRVSVPSLGSAFDIVEVPEQEAFEKYLSTRKAWVATPLKLKMYAGLGQDRTSSPTIK